MNDAIRTVMPDFASPSVADVPTNLAAAEQTLALVNLFKNVAANDDLKAFSREIAATPLEELAGRLDGALNTRLQNDLQSLMASVALTDESEVIALMARAEAQENSPATQRIAVRQCQRYRDRRFGNTVLGFSRGRAVRRAGRLDRRSGLSGLFHGGPAAAEHRVHPALRR